jgi:hypothetical protein
MPKECLGFYSQFEQIELIGCGRRAIKKEMEQVEKMRTPLLYWLNNCFLD